jgi:hypothetical protein
MNELVLISTSDAPLKSLVEGALENETRLLEAGIRRTELRLHSFETAHGLSTADFVRRFEDGEIGETLENAEWIGEYRLLERLRQKVGILRGIHIAN